MYKFNENLSDILILFFVWQLWDVIMAGRDGAAERIRKDEKYKTKMRSEDD